MALFTGSGVFNLQGNDARVYDCDFQNDGGLDVAATGGWVSNVIAENIIISGGGVTVNQSRLSIVSVTGDSVTLANSQLGNTTVTGDFATLANNRVSGISIDGVIVDGDDALIVGNQFQVDNTFEPDTNDALVLNGNFALATANKFHPLDSRYGVNIGGDCNMVVGNDFGDPADYGTDALNDAGTNTRLFWPADATYGDNFTDCETSP